MYFVRASCAVNQHGEVEETIDKIMDSFSVTCAVSTNEVYKSLLKREVPWEAERLAKSHYEKGNELFAAGIFHEAEEHFLRSMKLAPQKAQPRIVLGNLYFIQNRWDEAISQARAAVTLGPMIADSNQLLGMCYHYRNQTEPAIKEYGRAIELDPNCAAAHYGLAELYGENQMFDKGLKRHENVSR